MGLLDDIRQDAHDIINDVNDFAVSMTVTDPNGFSVTVAGLHTKHFYNVDAEGALISSKNAHISISEKSLTDLSYPVRDEKGEVNIRGHFVDVADSTGLVKQYVINTAMPNETIGIITCILGAYFEPSFNNYVVNGYIDDYFE